MSLSRRSALMAGSFLTLSACSASPDSVSTSKSAGDSSEGKQVPPLANPSSQANSSQPSDALDHQNPSSISVLVNKRHPINPRDWEPDDLVDFGGQQLRKEVAEAASELYQAAADAGLALIKVSGYRSYQTQVATYEGWVASEGVEMADKASARPGYSEHQTGLALDIGTGGECDLKVCFRETPEAKWLAENCHKYGFILRFPWMKQDITGYYFESWHFRYIGRDQAQKYTDSKAETLEGFWGFEPAPDYP